MSETQQLAQDELRSPTGEILDQSQQAKPGPQNQENPQKDGSGAQTEQGNVEGKDSKSILNQEDKKPAAAGAPEKYEPFKAPEGFVIAEEVNTLFKELGLPQAAAQKLIDYVAPQVLEALESPYKQYEELRGKWQGEVQNTYGSKLSDVKTTTSRALAGILEPAAHQAFKDAMDLTGAGDNPAFIHAFYEMAKRLSEGSHVKGGGPSKFGQAAQAKPQTIAQAMYPHLPSSAG